MAAGRLLARSRERGATQPHPEHGYAEDSGKGRYGPTPDVVFLAQHTLMFAKANLELQTG
jgi:hypothetical protein